jgi:cytochrome c553
MTSTEQNMEQKTPAKKAWETMRNTSPGKKAAYTKKRKEGARKAAAKVKNKQWEPKKVAYLKTLKEKANSNACVVCGDNRPFVLQKHHAHPEKKSVVTLCANCHDTVRRGTLEDLIKANKRNAK